MFALLKEMLVNVVDPEAPCKIHALNEQMKTSSPKYTLNQNKAKIHGKF